MTLATVDARYTAAGEVTIEHHHLDWPTMYDVVVVLRALRRARQEGISGALEDLLDVAGEWLRTLTAQPISPADPQLGTEGLASAVTLHRAAGLDSNVGDDLQTLAELLGRIVSEAHPASDCLEGVISRYGRESPADPPALYLAGDRAHTDALTSWLATEELDATVVTITALRDAAVRDAVVLLGPPARYLTSAWIPPERAALLSQWVLTCPPAANVHVLTWPGHGRLDTEVRMFPTSVPPRVREVPTRADRMPHQEPVWLPPLPVDQRVVPPAPWGAGREPVDARGLRLANDAVAFFPFDGGPCPEVVTWDGSVVQVNSAQSLNVTVGDLLLFHPERSAEDDELHRRADALLAARYGPEAPAAALAAKDELKAALRAIPPEREPVVLSHLIALIGDPSYARHILHALPDPDYIGPEKRGAYAALRRVLRLPEDISQEKEALLRSLRAARRKAGVEIVSELVDLLHTSDAWLADIGATGRAAVSAGPLFGQLEIRAVVAVDPTPRKVDRSRLGRILPAPVQASLGGDR